MFKKMRKIFSIFLSVTLFFSLTNVAFAKEKPMDGARSITAEPEGIVLQVDSQEEFDALVQKIEEENALANKMWEESEARMVSQSDVVKPMFYGTINYTCTVKPSLIGDTYKFALILRYEASTTGSITQFTGIYDFLVVPHVSSTPVSNVYWQYRYLDSNRACAVNTSFIASIPNIYGTYNNYDVTRYVEYYASGGAY